MSKTVIPTTKRYDGSASPVRWRVTSTDRRGEWSFGVARSLWPRPLPNGQVLWVLHVLWWNFILEIDR